MQKKLWLWLFALGIAALLFWWWLRLSPVASGVELPAHKPERFPHEIFDRVLKKYVDQEGRVDYEGLANSRYDLDLYIAYINKYSPESDPALFSSETEQKAYYLNAYNALVVSNVLANMPLQNIGDVKLLFFYRTTFLLGGSSYNLYELENQVIRPTFQDPRIHFALNCASLGCPKLPQEAFLPEQIEAQLERETREFLSEKRNVRVEGSAVHLSQIFEFYTEDFASFERSRGATGDDHAMLLSFINRFSREPVPSSAPVRFITYDWTLNSQSR